MAAITYVNQYAQFQKYGAEALKVNQTTKQAGVNTYTHNKVNNRDIIQLNKRGNVSFFVKHIGIFESEAIERQTVNSPMLIREFQTNQW